MIHILSRNKTKNNNKDRCYRNASVFWNIFKGHWSNHL